VLQEYFGELYFQTESCWKDGPRADMHAAWDGEQAWIMIVGLPDGS
jgi:hypothetical protein